MLQAALKYLERGFSVIPCKPDKTPYIKWEPYQKRHPTLKEVQEWWSRWPSAMVGIVTGVISGICVIDIDTDEGREAIQQYVSDSIVTPTCQTPKGGQHLYLKAPEKCPPNNARLVPGCDFRGEGGYVVAPPSMNGTGKAYAWMEGLSIEDVEPADLPLSYLSFINSFALGGYKGGTKEEHTKARESTEEHEMFRHGTRDNDLFHTANCLVKGGMPESEVSQVLERLILSWGENPDQKWIRTKVESAIKRADRRERNISEDVRKWVMSTEGHFLSTEYHAEARLSTREEKHAVTECLRRMALEGIIERYGDKRGSYRLVENECETIDFLNASDRAIDLRWPFGIERYFKTLPKNIIVIAGEPDAGKTAFLLEFTRINQARHKVHYFSSEMGVAEFRTRLLKFDIPLEKWTFDAKERASNFSDVIHPNDINIIDFLEIHDEFYRIGALIKEVYDKLKEGAAIIAIQKNAGTDYGLGGMRGLEKARLYLALNRPTKPNEHNRAKIVKAKNWATESNPNGLCIDFKLIQGCRFKVERDWYR
jgi:hypothetical protein